MLRKFHLAAAALVAILASGASVQAGPGGGGGGGSDGPTSFGNHHAAHAFFNNNRGNNVIGRALIAAPEPSGSTVLPGGTFFRLDGWAGNRDAEVVSPEHGRIKAKHIRTTYNRHTGITTIWLRNADGTRTGIHTDRAGNQMVSQHAAGPFN
jgi:hypothetical protein